MTEQLFIVDGMEIINSEISDYHYKIQVWEDRCNGILYSFNTKTSRVSTNKSKDNFKEYTYWYQQLSGGGLKSCGKERPDIESMYPPKPEYPIKFGYKVINLKHIIILEADYKNNAEVFGLDCYIFPYTAILSLPKSFRSEFRPPPNKEAET